MSTRVLQICIPVLIVWYAIRLNFDLPFLPEYGSYIQYATYPGPDAFFSCIACLMSFVLGWKLAKRFHGIVPSIVSHISTNINRYYCISVTITGILANCCYKMIGSLRGNVWFVTLIAAMILVLCYSLIEWYSKYLYPKIRRMPDTTKYLCYAGIWIASIVGLALMVPLIVKPANIWNDYLKNTRWQ